MGARVPSYDAHPVDRLFRAGVPLSISTDARTITDVTLAQEHERLRAAFGWTERELRACQHAALDAAFAPADLKRRLRPLLDA